jgi:aspartyl-tRNA(Asn)/glutamyl-tRNA(Gln) amidotransferase subunit C
MALTQEEVRTVAQLARLDLSVEELEQQGRHLNAFLAHIEALQGLDLTGVEPTSHSVPLFNVLRDDKAAASLTREEALQNAPESQNGCFVVPRIIEE